MYKLRTRLLILLGITAVSLICCLNSGPQIFALGQDVVLNHQLGDIPAPPSYNVKYSSYGGGWLLGYESDLSIDVLKEYYMTELSQQNWEIEHYSGTYRECILAKRGQVYRVIEITEFKVSGSKVHVRFNAGACSFSSLP